MITIVLGAEGEYGRRLIRYLERRVGSELRLVHFTQPGQWPEGGGGGDLSVMSRAFFDRLDDGIHEAMSEDRILWITDVEEEENYCRFHPPEELVTLIYKRTGIRMPSSGIDDGAYRITGVFSPVYADDSFTCVRSMMSSGDLYLGMEDLAGEPEVGQGMADRTDQGGHMGDLCYYIHLKDPEVVSRIGELSTHTEEGYEILPSPVVFLPFLELSADEYIWFFQQLRAAAAYPHIFVGLGCGIFAFDRILSSFDRLILIGSRRNRHIQQACEIIMRSLQAGFGGFSGSCDLISREEMGGSLNG